MPHVHGTHLGGLRTVEDLRLRCHCSEDGCWHFRKANGKPMTDTGGRMNVWLFGVGSTTATRAAWALKMGELPPPDRVVYRKCDSRDCVNPDHLRLGDRGKVVKLHAKRGVFATPQRRENARRAGRVNAKVTLELRAWLCESPQSGSAAAHALGITQGRANAIRAQQRKAVFAQLLKVAA